MTVGNFTIGNFLLVLLFALPGFIMDKIIRHQMPEKKESPTELLLDSLTYSTINFTVFSWIIIFCLTPYLTVAEGAMKISFTWQFIISSLTLIVFGPITLGVITAWLMNKQEGRIKIPDPAPPSAWDYFFKKYESAFVIVTFNDNSKLAGLYTGNSFASKSQEAQSTLKSSNDLFLEKLWKLGEDNKIKGRIDGSKGAWISGDNVKHLEFLEVKEDDR